MISKSIKRTYDICPKCGAGSECIDSGFLTNVAYEKRQCVSCDTCWTHHFKFTHDTINELSESDKSFLEAIK